MYRLFRVFNTARNGSWIAAADELAALEYAFTRMKMARKRENLKSRDVTDVMLDKDTGADSLRELLSTQTSPGHCCKQIFGPNIMDVMASRRGAPTMPSPPACKWLIGRM